MGKYPREETADVVVDSVVIVFSIPEFENLIYTNFRITLQMLKVFSNQLRRIHKQVSALLATNQQVDAEAGLFNIGQYYYKNGKYKQALYAFRRYLTYYPAGEHQAEAAEYLINIEKYPQGGGPVISAKSSASAAQKSQISSSSNSNSSDQLYYDGMTLFSEEKYEDAIKLFKQYFTSNPEGESAVKALSGIGEALYFLKKYDDCIKHFTALIQKYPKDPALPEFLFNLGRVYAAKKDTSRAESFFNKVISMTEDGSEIKRKAKKVLKKLAEEK
jgi:TolA-binding protein